jgi:hypothetical protein
MKKLDFLDKIKGLIAENFAPLIGKPNQELGAVHNAVGELIGQTVKEYGLLYSTWVLRPQDVEGFYLYEVELFKLNVDGLIRYKGRKYGAVGRWERAPRYEVMAAVAAPTVEEVIKRGIRQYIEKRIHENKLAYQELAKQQQDSIDRAQMLFEKLQNYI